MEMLSLLIFPLFALILFVLWKLVSNTILREVGRRGVANTPATVRLVASQMTAEAEGRMRADCGQLVALGFEEVGHFEVREVPGVRVSLFVHPPSSVLAIVYLHPRAGQWSELLARYEDGTQASASSAKPTGLNPRPGHLTIRESGARVDTLYRRLLAERPRTGMRPVSATSAVADFEQGYAEELAYRRKHSPTVGEVRAVARLGTDRAAKEE